MKNLYGRLWRWHFFAALIVIPFVLWQSTTGTLYLWSEWWMDQAHPQMRFVNPQQQQLPLSAQIQSALKSVESRAGRSSASAAVPAGAAHHHGTAGPSAGLAVERILLSDDPARSTTVLFQSGGSALPFPVFVNPYTGEILGQLSTVAWLPGISRALHGGWPLGEPGSWLLELGDGWAIFMLATGLYLWWPKDRGLAAFWPRARGHSCAAS